MAMQLAQAGERVAQCGGADSCPDDPSKVCIPANPPGLPPGTGAPGGGGNGPGHCPLIAGRNPCFPTAPGHPKPIAYQGPALPGHPCVAGGGAQSAPIGFAMGKTDTGTGASGNEANNVFLVNVDLGGNGTGEVLGNGGFLITTFGGQTWYEPPFTLPIYNGAILIDIGRVSVANNGTWSAGGFFSTVSNALNQKPNSDTFSSAVISELKSEFKNIASKSASASTPDCFSKAWDGKTTG